MKAFMDKDFMLQSATAQHLYHDYAAAMPICDLVTWMMMLTRI